MDTAEVYVCDLDGTLLRSDATLSPFSRVGLNRLLEAGGNLTVASARGTPSMRSLLSGVGIRLPVIELNGAFISEIERGLTSSATSSPRESPALRSRSSSRPAMTL